MIDARHRRRPTLARLVRGQVGLVGRVIVIWLLLLALLGLAAVDAASIMFTHFRLDDAASTAASTAVAAYRNEHDTAAACAAAQLSVQTDDPAAVMSKSWCKVDTSTGTVTITLRKTANTLVAGRLSFTRDLTKVVQQETAGPSAL